jgi:hypothetical protein
MQTAAAVAGMGVYTGIAVAAAALVDDGNIAVVVAAAAVVVVVAGAGFVAVAVVNEKGYRAARWA